MRMTSESCSSSHASVFPPFCKYHVSFQDPQEDNIGKMTEFTVCYIVSFDKNLEAR